MLLGWQVDLLPTGEGCRW